MARRQGKTTTGERTAQAARVLQPIYAVIGERMREARTRAGLGQAEAAAKLAMSVASLANIERGNQRIQLHDLVVAAQAYGANLGFLLGTDVTQARLRRTEEERLRKEAAKALAEMRAADAEELAARHREIDAKLSEIASEAEERERADSHKFESARVLLSEAAARLNEALGVAKKP